MCLYDARGCLKLACVLLVPFAMACSGSDDSEPHLGPPVLHPVPGCESIEPARCDVRLSECQLRLLQMAACLRGESAPELPAIRVSSEADYASYLAQLLASQLSDPSTQQLQAGLALLGLVERAAPSAQARAEDEAKLAGGIYLPDTKEVLIIDHGESSDAAAMSPVLVHELVHALQDRDVDLTAFEEQSTSVDESWAYRAMIEGEATLHATRYAAAMLGLDSAKVDWNARFQNSLAHDEQSLRREASPYLASYKYFPYEWGARYMYFTWLAGGVGALRGRFARPPTVTHTLLASTMGAVSSELTGTELTLAAAPAEWKQIAHLNLGAWGVHLAFEKTARTLDSLRAMALAWRGDALGIYASTEAPARSAVVWSLEFADESMASRAQAAAASIVGSTLVRREGPRVIIARAEGSQAMEWAFRFD